jgi:hypothetical protein
VTKRDASALYVGWDTPNNWTNSAKVRDTTRLARNERSKVT